MNDGNLDSLATAAKRYMLNELINELGNVSIKGSADIESLPDATTTSRGLMSASDKIKLDGLENYSLPTASETKKGGVKIGTGLGMNDETLNVTLQTATTSTNGLMSAADKTKLNGLENYSLPTAGSTVKGGIKIGDGLKMTGETLSVVEKEIPLVTTTNAGLMSATDKFKLEKLENYTLPTASESTKGGIKVGDGLGMNGETLNVTLQTATTSTNGLMSSADKTKLNNLENYTLPTASHTVKGGVKIGDGLAMIGESLTAETYDLPTASNSIKGGVMIGDGLSMDGDTLNVTLEAASTSANGLMSAADKTKLNGLENYSLTPASSESLGGIKIGDGLSIDAGGKLNVTLSGGSTSSTLKLNTVEYIKGTDIVMNSSIGILYGVTKDTMLYNGKCIIYELTDDLSLSMVTYLNLTLADGTSTGNIPIEDSYYSSLHSTACVLFAYNDGAWHHLYDQDTRYTYDRIKVPDYTIFAESRDMSCPCLVGSDDGAYYKQIKSGTSFDTSYPVLLNLSTPADSNSLKALYFLYPDVYFMSQDSVSVEIVYNIPYSSKSMAAYLKGTLSGTTFTVHNDPITKTVPTSADGYTYLFLGASRGSDVAINLLEQRYFQYKDGKFRRINPF